MQSYRRFAFTACLVLCAATGAAAPAVAAKPGPGAATSGPAALSFAADRAQAEVGEQIQLSWSATNLKQCFASGDWSGRFGTDGAFTTPPLDAPKTYVLECKSGGTTVTQTVSVHVNIVEPVAPPATTVTPPPPEAPPSLSLRTVDAEVRPGESATLSWSGTSVSNCRASGAWSGAREASGTETIGPLQADSSFTLTCESSSGNLISMTSVLVTDGGTTLSWVPPVENTDGTPLQGLLGYRIYVGTSSRAYHERLEVSDPAATSQFLALSRGEYFLAMTALDAEGRESTYSNEVVKVVN
jgi:hypothetical protein